MIQLRDPKKRQNLRSEDSNVVIKNLPRGRIEARELYELLVQVSGSRITSCKIGTDRNTGAALGYAFAQFASAEEAKAAIERINEAGIEYDGRTVSAELYKAEKAVSTIYIRGLPGGWSREDIAAFFQSNYGEVDSVRVPPSCAGSCFVRFVEARDADNAIRQLHNNVIQGRKLVVERAMTGLERRRRLLEGRKGGRGRQDSLSPSAGYRRNKQRPDQRQRRKRGGNPRMQQAYREGWGAPIGHPMGPRGMGPMGLMPMSMAGYGGWSYAPYGTPEMLPPKPSPSMPFRGGMGGVWVPPFNGVRDTKSNRFDSRNRSSSPPSQARATVKGSNEEGQYAPFGHSEWRKPKSNGEAGATPLFFGGWENKSKKPGKDGEEDDDQDILQILSTTKHLSLDNESKPAKSVKPTKPALTLRPAEKENALPKKTIQPVPASIDDTKKNRLGDQLYPLVHKLDKENAPKITGMLLELEEMELRDIIRYQGKLHDAVQQAQKILERSRIPEPIPSNRVQW